jgi:hypothetical protein
VRRSDPIRAIWNRKLPFISILAFHGHQYLIDIGSDHKPPLIRSGGLSGDRTRPRSLDGASPNVHEEPRQVPMLRLVWRVLALLVVVLAVGIA